MNERPCTSRTRLPDAATTSKFCTGLGRPRYFASLRRTSGNRGRLRRPISFEAAKLQPDSAPTSATRLANRRGDRLDRAHAVDLPALARVVALDADRKSVV